MKKTAKNLLSLVMTLCLALNLGVVAFADNFTITSYDSVVYAGDILDIYYNNYNISASGSLDWVISGVDNSYIYNISSSGGHVQRFQLSDSCPGCNLTIYARNSLNGEVSNSISVSVLSRSSSNSNNARLDITPVSFAVSAGNDIGFSVRVIRQDGVYENVSPTQVFWNISTTARNMIGIIPTLNGNIFNFTTNSSCPSCFVTFTATYEWQNRVLSDTAQVEIYPAGTALPVLNSGTNTQNANTQSGSSSSSYNFSATAVDSVTLSNQSIDLNVGDTYSLSAIAKPDNANYYDVFWSSSDNNIVSLSSGNGPSVKLTAAGVGSALVTVSVLDYVNSKTYSSCCSVTVGNYTAYTSTLYGNVGAVLTDLNLFNTLNSQYHSAFNNDIPNGASIKFVSLGSIDYGVLLLSDNNPVRANVSYSFAQLQSMAFVPKGEGTYSLRYSVSGGTGEILNGSLNIVINKGIEFDVKANASVGQHFLMSNVCTELEAQYQKTYGSTVGSNGIFQIKNLGSTAYGKLCLENGTSASVGTNYSYSTFQRMYLEPKADGVYNLEYSLISGNRSLTGTVSITIGLSGTYSFNVISTVGTDLKLEGVVREMISSFEQNLHASPGSEAVVSFTSLSRSNEGSILLPDGSPVQANSKYSLQELEKSVFRPQHTGKYQVSYSIAEGGNVLSGSVTFEIVSPTTYSQTVNTNVGATLRLSNSVSEIEEYYNNTFSTELAETDIVRFSALGNLELGTFSNQNGETLRVGIDYTLKDFRDIVFLAQSQGSCNLEYTLTNGSQTIIGTLVVDISGQQFVSDIFDDILDSAYYADAVVWAYQSGVTTGRSTGIFDPNGTITRGEAVTFLWRAVGKPIPLSTENPFEDISPEDYWYDAVLWAYSNQITNGTDARHFSPGNTLTRAQMVTFLWRVAGQPEKTGLGQWYEDSSNWAVSNDIVAGTSVPYNVNDNNYCPRCDTVFYLWRYFTKIST